MALWAMMASPLMAGNDLRHMTNETLAILTWKQAIEINQDPLGIQATECSPAPAASPAPPTTVRWDAVVSKCNGSAAQRWAVTPAVGSSSAVTLRQASSGMCLGVLPLVPAAACQNRVAPMDCATGGPATRWTMQPHVAADIESGTSTYVLVSQLNKQPLNVYGGPLDPGRRDREVQTCSPVNTQANNLWTISAASNGSAIHTGIGGGMCLGTGSVTVCESCDPPAGHPNAAKKDAQVYSKLLSDGSTALLLLNRGVNPALNVSADLGRCVASGWGQGAQYSVTDLRDGSALPGVTAAGSATKLSRAIGSHDHALLKLTPTSKASAHVCATAMTPYMFLRCPSGHSKMALFIGNLTNFPMKLLIKS